MASLSNFIGSITRNSIGGHISDPTFGTITGSFDPVILFNGGASGALYNASALNTQFTTYSSSTNITAAGQAVGFIAGGIPQSDKFLLLNGASGAFASTPAANLSTLDKIVARNVRLNDWTPAGLSVIAGQFNGSGGQDAFYAGVNAAGTIRFAWTNNGATLNTADSTEAPTVSNFAPIDLRIDLTSTTATFYTSVVDAETWVQLGDVVAITLGTIHNSNRIIEIGATGTGTGNRLTGRVGAVELYAGATLLKDFNPARDYPTGRGTTMVSSTTGETYTINGTALVCAEGDLFQLVSAARGTNAVVPRGRVTTLFARSGTPTETFTGGTWTNSSGGASTVPVVTENYAVAPDGTTTAARLQASVSGTASGDFSILTAILATGLSGANATSGVWVKSNTGVAQSVYFRNGASAINTEPVTTEWTQISATEALNAAATYFTIGARGTATGVATIDVQLWHPQVNIGDVLEAYQKVASASVITQQGVPSVPCWFFDGTDDYYTMGISSYGSAANGWFADTGNNWSFSVALITFATTGTIASQCGATDGNKMLESSLTGGEPQSRVRGTNNDSNTPINDGLPHLLQYTCTNGTVTLRIDGGARTTLTAGAAAAETNAIAFFARTPSSPANFLRGWGVPFLIDRALTGTEELQQYNDFAATWGA